MAAKTYRPEIDGLRALAVVPVVLSHAGFSAFSGGFLGVDVFFVISGYLIGGIIYSQLQAGTFSIRNFYERRARRILPALFVVLGASFFAAWLWISPDRFTEFGRALVSVVFFSSNIEFWRTAGYFAVEAELNPLLHTWSLAVEEQFYIVFPLMLLALRRVSLRTLVGVLALSLVVSLIVAEVTRHFDTEMAFYFLHTRAWELLAGAVIAIVGLDQTNLSRTAKEAAGALGLILYLVSLAMFDESTAHPGFLTLLPVLGAALMIAFARPDTAVGRLLCLPVLIWIGLISYSLYLVHQPVFAFIRLGTGEMVSPEQLILPMLACVALAYLLWRFVEQPFRNRQVVSIRKVVTSGAVAALLCVGIGSAAWATAGFPSRMGEVARAMLAQIHSDRLARQAGIRLGACHYNQSVDFDTFLENWNCFDGAEGPKLLTFGDSHSADKAWALRSVGVSIANIGGAGCPLVPEPKYPECLVLLERVSELVRAGRVDGVVLANRWQTYEAEPQYLDTIGVYWKALKIPVLIFTPMPEFVQFDRQIMRHMWSELHVDRFEYDAALLERIEGPVIRMAKKSGFAVLNTADLFCDYDRANCAPIRDGKSLLIDYGHLTEAGAKWLGARIVTNPDWRRWIDGLAATTASTNKMNLGPAD